MRNEEMNKRFDLDRETRDFIGEYYDILPKDEILRLTWNTNAMLWCFMLDHVKRHLVRIACWSIKGGD